MRESNAHVAVTGSKDFYTILRHLEGDAGALQRLVAVWFPCDKLATIADRACVPHSHICTYALLVGTLSSQRCQVFFGESSRIR